MKKLNIFIIFIIFSPLLFFSCESSGNQKQSWSDLLKNEPVKIQLKQKKLKQVYKKLQSNTSKTRVR